MLDRLTEPLDPKYDYGAKNILKYSDSEFTLFETFRIIEVLPAWFASGTYLFFTWILPAFILGIFGIEFEG